LSAIFIPREKRDGKATGTGTIKLNIITVGKLKSLSLLNVLYNYQLFSIIANKGFKIKFNIESANIFNEKDSVVLRAVKKDKLYVVKVVQPHEARFANP